MQDAGARRVSNAEGMRGTVRKHDCALPAQYTKHSNARGHSLPLHIPLPQPLPVALHLPLPLPLHLPLPLPLPLPLIPTPTLTLTQTPPLTRRAMGVLAMSRAIGDLFLKPYVGAEPEVS